MYICKSPILPRFLGGMGFQPSEFHQPTGFFLRAGVVFDKSGPGVSPCFTPVAAPASKNSPAQLWDCECLRNPGETVEILCGTSQTEVL